MAADLSKRRAEERLNSCVAAPCIGASARSLIVMFMFGSGACGEGRRTWAYGEGRDKRGRAAAVKGVRQRGERYHLQCGLKAGSEGLCGYGGLREEEGMAWAECMPAF